MFVLRTGRKIPSHMNIIVIIYRFIGIKVCKSWKRKEGAKLSDPNEVGSTGRGSNLDDSRML